MIALVLGVFVTQAVVMLIDELHFHRARSLPRWERWGHPLDTLSLLACFAVALVAEPAPPALGGFALCGVISCLLVTKDEFVHARHCAAAEHWLHALLFVLHPVVIGAIGWLWFAGHRDLLIVQAVLTAAFGLYQIVYWNLPWQRLLRAR
jgi:hypothetical protein